MTRDDIIRMAKDAEMPIHWLSESGVLKWSDLERFAALVAAAEREEIAKMIEDAPPLVEFAKNELDGCLICGFTPKLAASTIRARGRG